MIALTAALAQTSHAQHSTPSRPRPPVSCAAVADPSLLTRIETLFSAFAARWLQIGEQWFQAYELPGELRNPLLPKGDRKGPVRGVTWVQHPRCVAIEDSASRTWRIRIVANRITFNEHAGWTKPLPAGVLAEFVLSPDEAGWAVTDNTAAVSFRQPEDKEWRPSVADLPSRAPAAKPAARPRR